MGWQSDSQAHGCLYGEVDRTDSVVMILKFTVLLDCASGVMEIAFEGIAEVFDPVVWNPCGEAVLYGPDFIRIDLGEQLQGMNP